MLEIVNSKGERFGLPSSTKIKIIRESPLFSDNIVVGAFSFPFSLPDDPQTRKLLKFPHQLNSRGDFRFSDISLLDNGVPVIQNGQMVVRRTDGKRISVHLSEITASDKEFFSTKLKELDFGDSIDLDPSGVGGNNIRNASLSDHWTVPTASWPDHRYFTFPFYNDKFHNDHAGFGGDIGNDYVETDPAPEFRMKTDGQDRTPPYSHALYWIAPAVFVMTVLQAIADTIGYDLKGNVLEDPEFMTLGLFANRSINYMEDDNNVPKNYYNNLPRYLNFKHFVPDWSVSDLLYELRFWFGIKTDVDPIKKRFTFDFIGKRLNEASYIDLTNRTDLRYSTKERIPYSTELAILKLDEDLVHATQIKDLDKLELVDDVETVADLPAVSLRLGMTSYVKSIGQYYSVEYVDGTLTWVFYSYKWESLVIGEGTNPEVSKASTAPMTRDETRGDLMPIMRIPGNANGFGLGDSGAVPRFLFYRGLNALAATMHPYASSDEYDYDGTVKFNYSLSLTGDNGLKEKFLKEWLSIKAGLKPVKRKIALTRNQVRSLDLSSKIWIDGNLYLIKKFEAELPLKELADFELLRPGSDLTIVKDPERQFFFFLEATETGVCNGILGCTDGADIHWGGITNIKHLNQDGAVSKDYLLEVGTKFIMFWAYKLADFTEISFLSEKLEGAIPDFSYMENLSKVDLSTNNLTTWNGGDIPISMVDFRVHNNALDQTAVDGILFAVEENISLRGTFGWLYLHQGTNATPSAAGLLAKAAIQAQGWAVNTN